VLSLLDIPDFRRLWVGQLLSSLGTWLLVVAVPLYVFDLTGSTVATGAAFIAETLPAVILGPAAGVLVDRVDRRRLMIGVDVVRALAVLSMLAVRSPAQLWVIYAALFVENGAAQLFRPARQALIPALIESTRRLGGANAMFAAIDGLVRVIGSVAGGLLYLGLGFPALVSLDATSYLISALGCLLIRYRAPTRRPAREPPSGSVAELRAGIAHIGGIGPLRGLLLVTAAFYLANGALVALLVPYARTQLDVGPERFSYLLAALGIGYLVGSPLARVVIERFSPRMAVVAGIPMLAGSFLLAFAPREYPLTLLAFAAAGAPTVMLLVSVQTECQRMTPDALLGRVVSVFLTVEMGVSVAGAALGSTVAQHIGVMPVIDGCVLLLGALAFGTPQMIPPDTPLPHLESVAPAPSMQ
jgi:predicted MFS family arabinose efflux permease